MFGARKIAYQKQLDAGLAASHGGRFDAAHEPYVNHALTLSLY